jgi:hypothetical protein
MELGWALIAAAMSIDPWLMFCGMNVEGYIEQDIQSSKKS